MKQMDIHTLAARRAIRRPAAVQTSIGWLCILFVCLGLLSGCGSHPALPQAKEGTLLRKIQNRGKLVVGVKFDLPTFGYLNPKTNQMEGFDVALAHEVAAYIFGDASKVEFKEALTKDRIANLQNDTFDIVFATMAISEDRMKDIDFSVVYYTTGPRFLVPKNSPVRGIADVNGKAIGLTKGSIFVNTLRTTTGANLQEFDTQADAVQAMLKGHIDAVTANDIILYGHLLANPGLEVVGAQYSQEVLGAGVAKSQPELLDAVNTVIRNLKSSGKWKTIWQQEIGNRLNIATVPNPPSDDWRIQP